MIDITFFAFCVTLIVCFIFGLIEQNSKRKKDEIKNARIKNRAEKRKQLEKENKDFKMCYFSTLI